MAGRGAGLKNGKGNMSDDYLRCPKCRKMYHHKAGQTCPLCGHVSVDKKKSGGLSRHLSKREIFGYLIFALITLSGIIGYNQYRETEAQKHQKIIAEQQQRKAEKEQKRIARAEAAKKRNAERRAEKEKQRQAMTPQQIRQEKIEKAFSPWDGSHRQLTRLIKKLMNDPESYDHDRTTYIDKGDYIIVTTYFRGANKFGGIVRNWVKAKATINGDIIEVLDQG